jgi:hypothetical protein
MAGESREISSSAFRRLQALQKAYLTAAERIRAGDDYPDFFVEGSGPPWHEMWPEVISAERAEFSEERLLFVDRLAVDDYPDFFVEGSGPPWHERWPEVLRAGEAFDPANVQNRIRALKGLNVVAAFTRLSARAEAEREE